MRPPRSPFADALGPALDAAAPLVADHLRMARPTRRFRGEARRRGTGGGWLGRLFAWALSAGGMPPDRPVRFELENALCPGAAGAVMRWRRRMHLGSGPRTATGWMRFDPRRGRLVDAVGPGGLVEATLGAAVVGGEVRMRSRGAAIRLGALALPLPAWLVGRARTREWQAGPGRLGLSLILEHPWLGEYAGYDAWLEDTEAR